MLGVLGNARCCRSSGTRISSMAHAMLRGQPYYARSMRVPALRSWTKRPLHRAADLAPAARVGMRHLGFLLAAVALAMTSTPGWGAEPPLVLEAKIPLGAVRGRIDHFAVDFAHQ